MATSTLMNTTKAALLSYYFRRVDMSDTYRPQTFYFGLSSTEPLADGSGVTEPTIGSTTGYARVAVAGNTTNFTEPTSSSSWYITNASVIEFPEVVVDCGTMNYIFISTAATGGNIVAMTKLTTSRPMPAESKLTFPAGELKFTFLNATT